MQTELQITFDPIRFIGSQGTYTAMFSRECSIEEVVDIFVNDRRLHGVVVIDGEEILRYGQGKIIREKIGWRESEGTRRINSAISNGASGECNVIFV